MLATACGYTISEIDQMDMSEFDMLTEYWADHPPPHLMIAAYLGIKPKNRTNKRRQTPQEMIKLLKGVPGFTMH